MSGRWMWRGLANCATPDWGTVKSTENYERRFVMTFPNETLPKGRVAKNHRAA